MKHLSQKTLEVVRIFFKLFILKIALNGPVSHGNQSVIKFIDQVSSNKSRDLDLEFLMKQSWKPEIVRDVPSITRDTLTSKSFANCSLLKTGIPPEICIHLHIHAALKLLCFFFHSFRSCFLKTW